MRRYSSPKYTFFNLMPSSSATSLTRWPHPLPQSKSQNGVLIATASTSTPCSNIILTARLLSRPPDSKATAFGFFVSCFGSPSCCGTVSGCGQLAIKMICAPPLTRTLSWVSHKRVLYVLYKRGLYQLLLHHICLLCISQRRQIQLKSCYWHPQLEI